MRVAELYRLTIGQAAQLIAKKELSPLELTQACLERIQGIDARVNAFITVTAEEALAAAGQAQAAIAGGSYKGPLHGLPIAIKDLFATSGVRTTAGSRIMADHVPAADATVVARLKAAGAVILGKLNLHEFAFGATSVNPHYGAAHNPWHLSRIAGGSSGGSGAAVAASMCLGALGTDTGGSVRIPASLCGIVGLKPTYGRVSRHGVVPLAWSLDHVGPMTKTVEDAAIMLAAIAGPDPQDPASSDAPVPDYRQGLDAGVVGPDGRSLRLGVPRQHFFDNVDAEVLAAVRRAIAVLGELGAVVEDISLPHIDLAPGTSLAILLPEALAYHQRWLRQRPQDYGADVRMRLHWGTLFSATDYVQAQRVRTLLIEEWGQTFRRVDAIVTPMTPIAAAKIEESEVATTMALVRFTSPFNITGLPAISIPCGFTRAGLPIGLQIVGRWFDEATVLRVAHAYQQATEWHKQVPPV